MRLRDGEEAAALSWQGEELSDPQTTSLPHLCPKKGGGDRKEGEAEKGDDGVGGPLSCLERQIGLRHWWHISGVSHCPHVCANQGAEPGSASKGGHTLRLGCLPPLNCKLFGVDFTGFLVMSLSCILVGDH